MSVPRSSEEPEAKKVKLDEDEDFHLADNTAGSVSSVRDCWHGTDITASDLRLFKPEILFISFLRCVHIIYVFFFLHVYIGLALWTNRQEVEFTLHWGLV